MSTSTSTDSGDPWCEQPSRALLPVVIAHRGASGFAPEHTLAAYYLAIQQGADFIEPDLVSTADGVLVARHENELGATTDVAQRPEFAHLRTTREVDGVTLDGWFTEDFTLEQLKTLRVHERFPQLRPANARFDGQFAIPTLEEIFDLLAGVEHARAHGARQRHEPPPRRIGIYPETKHPSHFAARGLAMEDTLLGILDRYGYEGEEAPVFIQSFEEGNLRHLRERTRTPLVQLVAATGAPWDLRATGPGTGSARTYAGMITRRGLAQVAGYADAIGVDKTLVIPRTEDARLASTTSLVRDAHEAGLLVHAWTFRAENRFLPADLRSGADAAAAGDFEGELRRYLAAGLDGVFTDQVPPAVGVRDARLHLD